MIWTQQAYNYLVLDVNRSIRTFTLLSGRHSMINLALRTTEFFTKYLIKCGYTIQAFPLSLSWTIIQYEKSVNSSLTFRTKSKLYNDLMTSWIATSTLTARQSLTYNAISTIPREVWLIHRHGLTWLPTEWELFIPSTDFM